MNQPIDLNSAAKFMRHPLNSDQPFTVDPESDAPIIVAQIELADQIAKLLNDHLELDDNPANVTDILDVLASLGIVLSSIEDDPYSLNYASIAYFYALKNSSVPEIQEYLAN